MGKNSHPNWVRTASPETKKWEAEIDLENTAFKDFGFVKNTKLKFSIEKIELKYVCQISMNPLPIFKDGIILCGEETFNSLKEAKKCANGAYKYFFELNHKKEIMEY